MIYRCVLADPPWPLALAGQRKRKKEGRKPETLPYPTMTVEEIAALPVATFAAQACHLWLWTTNQHLEAGFQVMRAWGFTYLAPIHWIKPSGQGNWFIHRTQTLLFGYRESCRFPMNRYMPNVIETGDPVRHSQKPDAAYRFIEAISPRPWLELFARQKRVGWDVWGNEVKTDIELLVERLQQARPVETVSPKQLVPTFVPSGVVAALPPRVAPSSQTQEERT